MAIEELAHELAEAYAPKDRNEAFRKIIEGLQRLEAIPQALQICQDQVVLRGSCDDGRHDLIVDASGIRWAKDGQDASADVFIQALTDAYFEAKGRECAVTAFLNRLAGEFTQTRRETMLTDDRCKKIARAVPRYPAVVGSFYLDLPAHLRFWMEVAPVREIADFVRSVLDNQAPEVAVNDDHGL